MCAWMSAAGAGATSGLFSMLQSVGEGIFADIQAKKARKFQQKVLKNQVRWRMQDMQRAGLNPILALGTPSSAPGGVVADTPRGDLAGAVQRGVASAQEYRVKNEQVKNLEREREVMDAQIGAAEAAKYRDNMAGDFTKQQTFWEQQYGGEQRRWGIELDKANSEATSAQASVTKLGIPAAQAMADFYTKYPWAKPAGDVLGMSEAGMGAARQVREIFKKAPKGGGITIKNYPRR